MAKSGQSVALLQGIAKPAPALPGQSAAGVHQESSGLAPPADVTEDNPTNKGSTTDQAHAATSILQPLPPGLTPQATHTCCDCKAVKQEDEFPASGLIAGGWARVCMSCIDKVTPCSV